MFACRAGRECTCAECARIRVTAGTRGGASVRNGGYDDATVCAPHTSEAPGPVPRRRGIERSLELAERKRR